MSKQKVLKREKDEIEKTYFCYGMFFGVTIYVAFEVLIQLIGMI